jgi:serine/threonine protein phosphatase PrpC
MRDITYRRPIIWNSCAQTDVGKVRQINEDSIIAKPDIGLWAVADGMGGHQVGDVASNKIVTALDELLPRDLLSDYVDAVENCLLDVNQQMLEYAQIMFEEGTIGSTLVALLIKGRVGVCLWVGDSRLYRFRNHHLVQLTKDHSQLEEMIELGLISKAEAENHPQRNVITRAVGVETPLYVDVNIFSTQVGDIFLLCSDGLYNAVSEHDIIQALTLRNVEQTTSELVSKALANGAPDNVSVIIVQGNPGKISAADMAAE